VILLAILGILYNYLVKRFTRKWLVIGAVGICFLLQVLAIVASFRSSGLNAASKEGVKIENNAAVDAVAEMGGTMFCLIKTENIVPSKQPYRYGKSYVYAFTTLIPNLGFWEIHPAKKESNLGDWLTEELGLGYGTGFSMTAEAYANFGYFGFIAFFFWGWFLANIFGKIEISAQTRNYALMAFSLILFWFFLKLPRNCFINLVRPIFFVAAPIYLYCTKVKRN
jgi:oligosaccharide repeat unit polymerase